MIKAAVIAYSKDLAYFMKKSLEPFFAKEVEFHVYTTEDIQYLDVVPEKIVIISAYVIFKSVENKLQKDAVLQVFSFSLSHENLKRLEAVKEYDRALLVSVDYYNCMETITQIYEAGYQKIDFIPYSGEEEYMQEGIEVAVTPDEGHLVPKKIKKVIDIGQRIVDINCIIQLAEKLGIKDVFSSKEAVEARSHMVFGPNGLDKILDEAESVNDRIQALIEHMDHGVMITDISGKIYLANRNAKNIAGTGYNLEGFSIQDILGSIDFGHSQENVIKAFGKTVLISVSPMHSKGKKSGNIIILKNFEEVEQRQNMIRNKLSGKTHSARNTFADIIGSSSVMNTRIASAKRMALSKSSVLITGPSGSGKEIFAQSIHNASDRCNYNFVALNCAAIPENLLESELFGYEPGAFTGAKKEGKMGYFELAHKGTIFLDEIGEMPLQLQSKLLRVIEERSFSRIGSSKLIHIDVRIIAATNQNLEEQVRSRQFREDLFYRLNVLPLDLPPISERQGDAMEMLYHFRDANQWKWQLEEETKQFLNSYPWPGNVREIRNLAEYLDNQEEALITKEQLPEYMMRNFKEKRVETVAEPVVSEGISYLSQADNLKFILREGPNLPLYQQILELLLKKEQFGIPMGRLQMVKEFSACGYPYSEAEIRGALRKLSESGYIKSKRGAGGSYILREGKRLLEEVRQLIS